VRRARCAATRWHDEGVLLQPLLPLQVGAARKFSGKNSKAAYQMIGPVLFDQKIVSECRIWIGGSSFGIFEDDCVAPDMDKV
jgi:hypothetical protein